MPELDDSYQKNLEALVGTHTEQLRQSMFDLEQAQDSILEAYGDALWLKDRATALHSRRVAAFSIALGRAMQLGVEEIRQVARGAFLHDVGKLAIPDALLTKLTPYTAEERQIVQSHCQWGFQIVRKVKFLSPAADLVYSHHERWDGTGYPKGLKGEAIPCGARMIAVVNAFDAIVFGQSYRPPRSIEEAMQEIKTGSGTQLDPQVVAVFLRIPQTTWQDISNTIEEQNNDLDLTQ